MWKFDAKWDKTAILNLSLAVCLKYTVGTSTQHFGTAHGCCRLVLKFDRLQFKNVEFVFAGLRVKEKKDVYEGEVTEISPFETENPLGGAPVFHVPFCHYSFASNWGLSTCRLREDGQSRGGRSSNGQRDQTAETRPEHLRGSAQTEGRARRCCLH